MTVPEAFAMLGEIVSDSLALTGFVTDRAAVMLDDPDAVGPSGDELVHETWAALTRGETRTVGTILGSGKPRYVVEHRASLELAWAGPDRPSGVLALAQALAAVAALPGDNPTLNGTAERFFIEGGSEEGLPPNGWRTTLICAFRIRSSDPLGLTP